MIEKLNTLSKSATISPILLFLCSISIAIFHDIGRSYLLASDADIVYVYQALLFNEGLKQEYFDHTGYIYFVILSIWIKVAYFFSFVDVEKLSQLPGPVAFEPSFAKLVFAGRWLAAIWAGAFAVVFYFGLCFMTKNPVVSFVFSILFALSSGLVNQSLVMRTELPAMFFLCLAFFMLVKAIHEYRGRQIFYLGLACFLCLLALMSKMQIIFMLLGFPIFAFLFGRKSQDKDSFIYGVEQTSLQLAFVISLLALSVPAVVMIGGAIARSVRLGSDGGWYQIAIGVYLIGSVMTYGLVYRYSKRQVLFALVAVLFGISLGQSLHLWHHSFWNTYALANFLEHMTQFGNQEVRYNIGEAGVLQGFPLIKPFLSNLSETLDRVYFEFRWAQYPLQPLYWLVTLGVLLAVGYSSFSLALQTGTLLCLSILFETITRFRYWVSFTYAIFSEPLILIAGALLIGTLVKSELFEYLKPAGKKITYSALALIFISILSLQFREATKERGWYSPEIACGLGKGFMARLPGYFDQYCKE